MITSNKDVLSWHRSATSEECLNVFEIILNCFLMMLGTLFGVLLVHITKKVLSHVKRVLKPFTSYWNVDNLSLVHLTQSA